MNIKNRLIKNMLMLLVAALAFSSCTDPAEEPDNYTAQVNNGIKELMKEWYLWNDQVPSIDVSKYSDPEAALNALTYKPTDKWSFMMDTVEFKKYFEEGKVSGFGTGLQLDENNNLRVTFVYQNSPAAQKGITRGYKISKLNGTNVSTLLSNNSINSALDNNTINFQFVDLSGNTKDISLTKQELNINTVLHKSVETVGNIKVGYLVFESFIETSNAELDEAFAYFKSEGVTELVLDLRYNGGGSLEVSNHLASLIGAGKTSGKKYVELTYNKDKQAENQAFTYESPANALQLDRVFVIATKSSASASEALIVGLKPYLPVFVIGDDTHGKPVGMNIFTIGKYAVAPITFKVVNSVGEGDYFSGIKANSYTSDNLNYDFGDERENSLKQALYYIQNGSFDNSIARTKASMPTQRLELKGFRAELGFF
jgi:carboxyl-terminal processing protease